MSDVNSNLEITRIEDPDQLARKIEDFYKADSTVKSDLSYNWDRNHLFLDSKQWLVYEGEKGRGGQWRTLGVSRANEYIPRPVTNYIFDVYQTLKAYLTQHRPRVTVIPNTQTYRDKMAAKLATLVCETNWERLREERNYEYAAACALTYGTVFKKDFWDTTTLMMAKVPRVEEQPITDPMTGAVIGYEEREVVDPNTGEVIFDEMPLGDINTAIIEPQRLGLDPLASDLHNARWVIEYSIQPLEWINEQYGKDPATSPGFTGRAAEVKEETQLSNSLRRWYQLKTSSGTRNGPGGVSPGNTTGQSAEAIENTAVVKEYYERPSLKHPKGRMVVVANGIPLYVGDSPYSGPELGDWHPYSDFRWEIVPGRFWGKGPLDDTVEIQKHINSIDAVITLTRKTQAIPQKLIPNDSGIKPGQWTGRPGQEVYYRSTGAAPSIVPASGVHAQVWKEREQKLEDMKIISGAVDILKGDRPPGVTAASALEMLFEVGTGKLKPALDRWKWFVESSQKKQLKMVSTKYREPREDFIRMLRMKNKELSYETISNFIGTDLYDNCNVSIEAGSNIPKLQSAEKSMLMEMAKIGTLNLEDPQNQMEFNRRMGIRGFDNHASPDVKRAEWENDLLGDILNSNDNQTVVLADDDHAVHKQIHSAKMKEPAFMSLPAEVQQAFVQHIMQHDQFIAQQQEMAALSGQPVDPNMPPQADNQPAGDGAPSKVQAKIMGADLNKVPG